MPVSGRATLKSSTGEIIKIEFDAAYSGRSGSDDSWQIVARNIRYIVIVPDGRPLPDQYEVNGVFLERTGNKYTGVALDDIVIRSGGNGSQREYRQVHEFMLRGTNLEQDSLIDPINHTTEFRTDFYRATKLPSTIIDQWPVG
jgi:hypothetical protein